MLAHLKAKQREQSTTQDNGPASSLCAPNQVINETVEESNHGGWNDDTCATQMTCDALCSLSSCGPPPLQNGCAPGGESPCDGSIEGLEKRKPTKSCPKQHQLPMFLSKTYHMIDRCDPEIATWSASGDNFVVKNVEKFASNVLPLYFKHSNFSSFARQLNFYGFRKLRTDPILTSDVDPRTACYVRFYHEKFQKDRPELLHHIKRATKSDQQSKDDVEGLKGEVARLKDCINSMAGEFDRKIAELSYEYNRRITAMSADYDKLAVLVQQVLAHQQGEAIAPGPPPRANVPDLMHSLSQAAAISLEGHVRQGSGGSQLGRGGTAAVSAGKRIADEEAPDAPPTARFCNRNSAG